MVANSSIVLLDCENLTGKRRLEAAGLWLVAASRELFGREAAMAPWRAVLAERGGEAGRETPVPDDAPSQAADLLMAERAGELARTGTAVVIASNDRGFDAVAEGLRIQGLDVRRVGDPDPCGLLRLVVDEIAGPDGWAAAGGLGDHLSRRFAVDVRRRLPDLARRAGLGVRRDRHGLWIAATTA